MCPGNFNCLEAADGYTLLYSTSSITIASWVDTRVGFDPIKDFTPVALTAEMPLVLMVNPKAPARRTRAPSRA